MNKNITRIQLFKSIDSLYGNSTEGYLDVKGESDFPITFSIGDIRNIAQRNGSFSKTIPLVGNKNNNLLLNNYFDVNVKSGKFDINKEQRCAVIQNDVVILDNAFLRIINVRKIQSHSSQVDDLVEYEVEIRDSVGTFFNTISNLTLEDLNLSQFDHTYDNAAIIDSYSHSSDDGYGYVLPWINNNIYNIQELMPGIFAKTYWDNIHSESGFIYEWEGLTHSNCQFDRLIIPYSGDIKKLTEEDKIFNEVIAQSTATQTTTINTGQNTNLISWLPVSTPNEIKDDQNLFNSGTGIYTNPFTILIPNKIQYQVEIDFDFLYNNSDSDTVYLSGGGSLGSNYHRITPKLRVYNISNNWTNTEETLLFTSLNTSNATVNNVVDLSDPTTARLTGSGTLGTVNYFPVGDTLVASGVVQTTINTNTNLSIGDLLSLYVGAQISTNPGVVWKRSDNTLTNLMSPYLRINNINIRIVPHSDNGLLPGQPMSLNRFVPKKFKQGDFIKSIVQKYNLFVEVDKNNPNKLIYKTRDKYYDEGEIKDWTSKLAKSREQIIEFVPELSSKRCILSYRDDTSDALLTSYKNETNETYGQIEVIFDNENVRGTERKEEIFSPTINLPTDLFNANLPVLSSDFKYNVRCLLHNGVRSCDNYTIQESASVSNTINYYPFISMLDEITNPSFDISYGINDYYSYDIINYTANNLYTNYWRRTFAQLNQGKMFTAHFRLNEVDISKLNLSDKIKVNNSLWYINSIIDYKANKYEMTKVELLSVEDDLFLPEFGSLIRPKPINLPKFPEGPKQPVKPRGPIKPYTEPIKEIINTRNRTTSSYNRYVNSINMGVNNIINTDNSIIIGDNKIVNESGFHINDTKLVDGALVMGENSFGSNNTIVLGDGITASSPGVYGTDWSIGEDGIVINGVTAIGPSGSLSYDLQDVLNNGSTATISTKFELDTSLFRLSVDGEEVIESANGNISSSALNGRNIIINSPQGINNGTSTVLIGGSNHNVTDGTNGVVVGGRQNEISGPGFWNTVVGGIFNDISAIAGYNTIVGGGSTLAAARNIISGGGHGVIVGGRQNEISGGDESGIFGGVINEISGGMRNFIFGGVSNEVIGPTCLANNIFGGQQNLISGGDGNSIYAGASNEITGGDWNAIFGGVSGTMSHDRSAIVGGNGIVSDADDTVFVPNLKVIDSIRMDGNVNTGDRSIVGGVGCTNSAAQSLVIGLSNNNQLGGLDSIVGGQDNTNNGFYSIVSGIHNNNLGQSSIVSGFGCTNSAAQSLVIGDGNNNLGQSSIVSGSDNTNSGGYSIVSGENNNIVTDKNCIVGGQLNTITRGLNRLVIGYNLTLNSNIGNGGGVLTGAYNIENGVNNIVGGGWSSADYNTSNGDSSLLVGESNINSGNDSILGGLDCTNSAAHSFVIGDGNNNQLGGIDSIVGGLDNINSGNRSIVSGISNNNSGIRSIVTGTLQTNSTSNGVVIGGGLNVLNATNNSAIIGGSGITLSLSNAVAVPDLVITKSHAIPVNTADSVGMLGSVTWDNNYWYVKTSVGWKRSALSTF